MVKKKSMDDVVSEFLNNLSRERGNKWISDPRNKQFVEELKQDLKSKAHVKIHFDDEEE